jgi:hypothetical protein
MQQSSMCPKAKESRQAHALVEFFLMLAVYMLLLSVRVYAGGQGSACSSRGGSVRSEAAGQTAGTGQPWLQPSETSSI